MFAVKKSRKQEVFCSIVWCFGFILEVSWTVVYLRKISNRVQLRYQSWKIRTLCWKQGIFCNIAQPLIEFMPVCLDFRLWNELNHHFPKATIRPIIFSTQIIETARWENYYEFSTSTWIFFLQRDYFQPCDVILNCSIDDFFFLYRIW